MSGRILVGILECSSITSSNHCTRVHGFIITSQVLIGHGNNIFIVLCNTIVPCAANLIDFVLNTLGQITKHNLLTMSQSNNIVGIQLHRLIIIKRTSGDLINVANSCTSILASIDTLRICESHTESKRLLQIAKIAMNSFAQGQAMNIIIFTVLAIIVGKSISILDFLSITAQHNVNTHNRS